MRQEDADKMYREIERTIYRQAEDAKEVEEMFKMIDADGSGEVDKAEFEAAFSQGEPSLGQKARKMFSQVRQGGAPSWEDVLAVLDADASGTVSWDEIVAFIK